MIRLQKKFMQEAIREARRAQREGDYAIGAVLVKGNRVIATASSRSKRDESPLAHAETLAIAMACQFLKRRHLSDCILYTTHEPCPMCAGAVVWAKLGGVVYGARIADMKRYRIKNANEKYLWRTIDIPCVEVIKKSRENIAVVKDFCREECCALFHC